MEKVEGIEPGLEVLVKRGYIKIEKVSAGQNRQNPQNPRKGGRPSWVVYLTPAYIDWKQQQM